MTTLRIGPGHPPGSEAPVPISDSLLTIADVARRLCVARSTVYELISQGDLPAVHIGRARRIPLSAVDRFILDRIERERNRPG